MFYVFLINIHSLGSASMYCKYVIILGTSVGIFPGTFPFSSPGTFGLLWSWENRTTGPSRYLGPVLSYRDLGPLVPGLPRTSRDLFGKLFEKKKSIQKYMFFYFCKFFLAKLLIFDCEP